MHDRDGTAVARDDRISNRLMLEKAAPS